MSKDKFTQQVINVKRRLINLTKEQKEFIFHNINYRCDVWNAFVTESEKYDTALDFKALKYEGIFLDEVDIFEKSDPLYCVGIPEQVAKDVEHTKTVMKAKKNFDGILHHHGIDWYRASFKVNAKGRKTGENSFNSRVKILSSNKIMFRAHRYNHMEFTLKEPLFYGSMEEPYALREKDGLMSFWDKDIRDISFLYEFGKFYIQLGINVSFYPSVSKTRKKKAGIDMGIHNPMVLKDSDGFQEIHMPQKMLNRIHYLERRITKLHKIMGRKYRRNEERGFNPYSKNYEKVRKKFRITWKKIRCLRENWRKVICKQIATKYKKIVVDNFHTPDNSTVDLPTKVKQKLNVFNRIHAMSLLMEYLPYACLKYGCEYIKAPKDTTRTCCKCGHVNEHLPLSRRIFTCDECGLKVDRDYNASQNCYQFG